MRTPAVSSSPASSQTSQLRCGRHERQHPRFVGGARHQPHRLHHLATSEGGKRALHDLDPLAHREEAGDVIGREDAELQDASAEALVEGEAPGVDLRNGSSDGSGA